MYCMDEQLIKDVHIINVLKQQYTDTPQIIIANTLFGKHGTFHKFKLYEVPSPMYVHVIAICPSFTWAVDVGNNEPRLTTSYRFCLAKNKKLNLMYSYCVMSLTPLFIS